MRLHLSNFPFSTSANDLRDILAPFGPVTGTRVMIDRETGQPLGYGFADVRDGEGAIAALNGTQYGGRRLDVRVANPPRRLTESAEVRA